MVNVAIQPSYGSADTRKRYADTLAQEIPFTTPDRTGVLGEDERRALLAAHPNGRARFWGGVENVTPKIKDLDVGDVVLFTGDHRVRASAEITFKTRNEALGRQLWKPKAGDNAFVHVYAVRRFRTEDRSYEWLRELAGYQPKYDFYTLTVLKDERARRVLRALEFETAADIARGDAAIAGLLEWLKDRVPAGIVSGEKINVDSTSYSQEAREVTVRRVEPLLVAAYRQHLILPDERLRTPVGHTDLHVGHDGGVEIIEAKARGRHADVRQAVGQLIDYAYRCGRPVVRLTGLFGAPIAEDDVAFLHHLGIDCVYRQGDGFTRRDAAEGVRVARRAAWIPV